MLRKVVVRQLGGWIWVLGSLFGVVGRASAQTDLTVDVLINSANTTGYNTSPTTPGEYQRYPERYFEHLQIPYRVIDVSITVDPTTVPSLATTPLIIAGHRGLNLNSAWQQAIANAVDAGAGFVNLDSDPGIGNNSHMQQIFGCASSVAGTPGTAITLPAAFLPDGATPHYITGLQMRFPIGNPASASGNLVYNFHQDDNNVLNTATSTICQDNLGNPAAGGTVLATIGNDALITATTFGSGNAVNFGTYDYLRADRFGFVMGLDDLFWRSLVWAARKPFVMRGHPRFFAVQQDDTVSGWGTRVQEMFNASFTGTASTQTLLDLSTISTGGPWKVTGNMIADDSDFTFGTAARQTVLDLVNAPIPFLRVSPQANTGTTGGDLFWTCPCPPGGAPLTDTAWTTTNLPNLIAFQKGAAHSNNGGSDFLPFAAHLTPHFWDLSDNTGTDLKNLGFRYITEIQQPNVFYGKAPPGKTPAQRLQGFRPFRLYEQPPDGNPANPDELWSVYWADDYIVHSTVPEGSKAVTFFGFATQLHGMAYPQPWASWPDAPAIPDATALENWQAYIWRFWSGMAPVQVYNQDGGGMASGTTTEQENFITALSTWMKANGANQNVNIFMDDLGAYLQARTQSTLASASLNTSGANPTLTLTLTGNATDGNSNPTNTYALVFLNDDNGNLITVPGFASASSPFTTNPITLPSLPAVETDSTVSASTQTSTFDTPVIFNASVTSSGVTTPGGNISLFDGNTSIITATLDSSGHAKFSVSFFVLGTHPITVHYAGDSTHLPSTSGTPLSVTINQAATSTTVSGGGAATFFGNPVTFNATVTSTDGMPTGTVSLLDGGNSVGSATLDASGHASFSISTLTVGTHTISVGYSGDTDFATSNSSTVTQTVNAADFNLSATSSVTVTDGQSGTATITVTPEGVFGSAVNFTCSGLPAESSCNFNPSSFTPNGVVTSTTVTLTTTAPSAVLHSDPFARFTPFTPFTIAAWLTGIAGLILLAQQRRQVRRWARCGAAAAVVLVFAGLISSCGGGGSNGGGGGGGGNAGTPRGTSTVVVTATSAGNVSHQVNITFTVQ